MGFDYQLSEHVLVPRGLDNQVRHGGLHCPPVWRITDDSFKSIPYLATIPTCIVSFSCKPCSSKNIEIVAHQYIKILYRNNLCCSITGMCYKFMLLPEPCSEVAIIISQTQLQDMPNRLCSAYIQLFCNSHQFCNVIYPLVSTGEKYAGSQITISLK